MQTSVAIHGVVCWRQLADTPENGLRVRHVLVGEVFVDGAWIELARHAWHLQKSLQLAGEQQTVTLDAIHERLLSQAVAGQHQLTMADIPNGEGEHSFQVSEEINAVFFV